jgi:tripartite-type tricarboxylate transporter receptor subunit TctC
MLSSLPLAKGKAIKALAVTSAKRLASAPEIPTVAESGMTGFEFVSWYGLWAPKDLPPALVEKLQTEVAKILAQPDMKQRLETLGFEPVGSTTEYFTKFIADEMEKSARIIADAKIKTE